MFPNIPPELEGILRGMSPEHKAARYAAAAYEVVKYFTKYEAREHIFAQLPIKSDLERPGDLRLIDLGVAIFALRADPILPEISRRLAQRDARSTYFEVIAAGICKEMGFVVHPSPGRPRQGEDFDF